MINYPTPIYRGYFGRYLRWCLCGRRKNMYQLGIYLMKNHGVYATSSINRYGNGQSLPQKPNIFIAYTVEFLDIRHPGVREQVIARFTRAYEKDMLDYLARKLRAVS